MAYFGSAAQHADYLINGFWGWSGYGGTGARKWDSNTISVNVASLGDADRALAQTALALWADVANLTINYTTGAANITYATPGGGSTQADCAYSVNSGKISNAVVTIGQSYGGAPRGETFIHETGHALGLGHLGPYNGNMSNSVFTNDTVQYSVMSYGRQNFSTNVGTNMPVDSPAMSDIYAVQLVYGANTTVRNTATIYGFNSNAGATYNFSINTQPNFTIYDTGGTDTIDASGYGVAQTINLNAGTWSSIGGFVNNIGIYLTSTIENAIGGSGVDTIHGNGVGNRIEGRAGDDTLYGNAGSDTLLGGAGKDYLHGGAGSDTASYADSGAAVQASLTLGTGKVTLNGALVVDTFVEIENLEGSAFGDSLSGDGVTNSLYGLGGDDTLDGVAGADYLDGGTGSDTASYTGETAAIDADLAKNATYGKVMTSTGEDTLLAVENIIGSNFNDKIKGDAVGNVLSGGLGNDAIEGRAGADTLNGGAGNDTLDGGADTDTVTYISATTGISADLVSNTGKTTSGTLETDTFVSIENLTGSNFNDNLGGNNGANVINGGLGNDTISGGGGIDSLSGGDGVDTVSFAGETVAISADLSAGKVTTSAGNETILAFENIIGGSAGDTLGGTSGDNVMTGLAGNDTMSGLAGIDTADYSEKTLAVVVTLDGATQVTVSVGGIAEDKISGFENVIGGSGNDTLTGDILVNVLSGSSGNDILDGKAGADTMNGGGGADTYFIDDFGDKIIDGIGGGIDVATATISYALGAGVEMETLQLAPSTGTISFKLIGNELAGTLIGNAGANVLDGRGGVDTLRGLAGDDTYGVDNIADKVFEAAGGGNDTIVSTAAYVLAAGEEIETLQLASSTGFDALNLTGNEFGNTLIGNKGTNVLDGKTGIDSLRGRGGDDIYVVDQAGDSVVELVGEGADTVVSTVSYALGAGQEIEILQLASSTGTAAFKLIGNEFGNRMIGNKGDNLIDGKAGIDVMIGRAGNDTYVVDNTGDRVGEAIGDGFDTIVATSNYLLADNQEVEQLQFAASTGAAPLKLYGNNLVNAVFGNAGDNVLDGKGASDELTGKAGADTFAFTTALGAGNIDRITDFTVVDDAIRLFGGVFSALSTGVLAANLFKDLDLGAQDGDDRVLYERSTGKLFYDADALGAGVRQQFALLENKALISNTDFFIV